MREAAGYRQMWFPRNWGFASLRVMGLVSSAGIGLVTWMVLVWLGFGHIFGLVFALLLSLEWLIGLGLIALLARWMRADREGVLRRLGVVMSACLLLIGWGGVSVALDVVVGTHWWYKDHVSTRSSRGLVFRGVQLKSIHLTRLYDRNHKYLGVFSKTRSNWNSVYNAPDLLRMRVAQSIQMAEGKIQRPSWWWKLMPKGRQLHCAPFSFVSFLKAPYYWLAHGRKVGGSPPSLQAAKNVMDFGAARMGLSLRETFQAKLFKEMPRAYLMCLSFSPRDMMGLYMTTLWAGKGDHYGLHRMASYFFGREDISRLSWNQSAVLAASLPNPGHMNPWYLQSCLKGHCESKQKRRVYRTWKKRIRLLKEKIRAKGFSVPKHLPLFRNGLDKKLKAISNQWKSHDLHIRRWLPKRF